VKFSAHENLIDDEGVNLKGTLVIPLEGEQIRNWSRLKY